MDNQMEPEVDRIELLVARQLQAMLLQLEKPGAHYVLESDEISLGKTSRGQNIRAHAIMRKQVESEEAALVLRVTTPQHLPRQWSFFSVIPKEPLSAQAKEAVERYAHVAMKVLREATDVIGLEENGSLPDKDVAFRRYYLSQKTVKLPYTETKSAQPEICAEVRIRLHKYDYPNLSKGVAALVKQMEKNQAEQGAAAREKARRNTYHGETGRSCP